MVGRNAAAALLYARSQLSSLIPVFLIRLSHMAYSFTKAFFRSAGDVGWYKNTGGNFTAISYISQTESSISSSVAGDMDNTNGLDVGCQL